MGLYWDASYAIVQRLIERYPDVDVDAVGIRQLHQMVVTLPEFADDPDTASDAVLEDILREWYEEVNP